MYDTMKDRRITSVEVIEKFGVPPDKVIEVQALIGDSTDNVPGVPGIGVKTAAQLIAEFGDLETLLARAGEIKQDKRRQALIDHAEAARTFQAAGDARRQRQARRAGRGPRRPSARLPEAPRFPQSDGIHHLDAPRGGAGRDRRRANRAGCEAECQCRRSLINPSPARGGWRRASGAGWGRCGKDPHPAAFACHPPSCRRRERESHPHLARRGAGGKAADDSDRPLQIRDRAHTAALARMGRARHRRGRCLHRHRDDEPRSDAGDAVRLLARGRAERSGLRAARAPEGGRRWIVRWRPRNRSNSGKRRARGDEAAAGRSRRAQDRPKPEIRHADFRAARHRARAHTTTPC